MERLKISYQPYSEIFPTIKDKKVSILMDIETFLSNLRQARITGKKKDIEPLVFSVACGVEIKDTLYYNLFKSFNDVFDTLDYLKKYVNVEFVFYNGDRFDNHFLLTALEEYLSINSQSLKNNKGINNKLVKTVSQLKNKKDYILEKRVKASTYVTLKGKIKGRKFNTLDLAPKFQQPLAKIGKTLNNMNILPKKYMKTSMNYHKYDRQSSVLNKDEYVSWIHKFFTKSELTYIKNDIILLYYAKKYYNRIFPIFDYDAITLTKNISNTYTSSNNKASFQLLKSYEIQGEKYHLDDDEYLINENFTVYEYIKKFYKGGLNFFNDKYIEKKVKNLFSIDINSSYPYQMYSRKFPTYLLKYEENVNLHITSKKDNDTALFVELHHTEFTRILKKLKSKLLKQMFTKYYNSTDGSIYITDITLELLSLFVGEFDVHALSVAMYQAEYFEARDMIKYFYKVKSTASVASKQNKTLVMEDPTEYKILDEDPSRHFELFEVDLAKLNLNGIYGVAALRSAFNTFQYDELHELETIEGGMKNATRNIAFASYVTSGAFHKLLEPLLHLTGKEIDDNFVYADTDSLYLKDKIKHKLPQSLYDPIALGKWDIENHHIDEFYVQNHKKYCYRKGEKFFIKAGGVKKEKADEYTKTMKFDDFIKNHFTTGKKIDTIKSVRCKNGHIAILDSEMILSPASKYSIYPSLENMINYNSAIEEVRQASLEIDEEFLYAETAFGSIGMGQISKHVRSIKEKSLEDYFIMQDEVKKDLEGKNA